MTTHAKISYTKSAIRILGYVCLWPVSHAASIILVVSELIGIVEEFGH